MMRVSHRLSVAAAATLVAGAALASSVIGLSIEDQARLARWVVVGRIVSQQGVVHPLQGIETEVRLEVGEVFKGDVRPGDVLVFHTRGGQVGLERSQAVGEARFETGKEALVFVEEVDGRPYLLGLSMGAWNVHRDAGGRTLFTRAIQDGLDIVGDAAVDYGPVSATDLANRVLRATVHPAFDHPLLRETLRERR